MGWLKEWLKELGHNSPRSLAYAMRDREESPWPSSDKRDVESVANKLRDLDKGRDSSWWTGKGKPFLPALAYALEVDQDELVERIACSVDHPSHQRVAEWTFRMFPALRRLDLKTENPFPGIPAEIMRSGGPRSARTWWIAPRGAGKTLVGQWLEAQHGWVFLQCEDWDSAMDELPQRGRVYLEIADPRQVRLEAVDELDALRLCVAARTDPRGKKAEEAGRGIAHHLFDGGGLGGPDGAGGDEPGQEGGGLGGPDDAGDDEPGQEDGGLGGPDDAGDDEPGREGTHPDWRYVRTPPAEEWMNELIGWVGGRARVGGGFHVEKVRKLFAEQGLIEVFDTPGEALGFFGIIDNVGLVDMLGAGERAVDPMRWVRVWLRAALKRPDRRRPPGVEQALQRDGAGILVEMIMERLRRGWEPVLSLDQWSELVPQGEAPELDRDALVKVVEQGGEDALDRLRAMLAPDARSLVRGLEAAGAFGPSQGKLSVQPTWLSNTVTTEALVRLYTGGLRDLGALFLYEETVEFALYRLLEDTQAGRFESVERCISVEPSSPEAAAALDGAVRAVGFALAAGKEVPQELVQAVRKRQAGLLVTRYTNWPPVPLLSVKARDSRRGATTHGAWFFAVFAITRALQGEDTELPSGLNPWTTKGDPEVELIEALSAASASFRADSDEGGDDSMRLAVFRMGGDLLCHRGVLRRHDRLLDMQLPDIVVTLSSGEDLGLSEEELRQALQLACGVDALADACSRAGCQLDEVLAWCWRHWSVTTGIASIHLPPFSWIHRSRIPDRRRDLGALWSAAPADTLPDEFYAQLHLFESVWPHLPETVWARWLQSWSQRESRWADSDEVFTALPVGLALEAVRDGSVNPWCGKIRRVLWNRLPEELLALVDELIGEKQRKHPGLPGHGGPVADLVMDAPEAQIESLVNRAQTWLQDPTRYAGVGPWVLRWLLRVVESRGPGWRAAFELLTKHQDLRSG